MIHCGVFGHLVTCRLTACDWGLGCNAQTLCCDTCGTAPPPLIFVCNELWDISVDKMAALMWTFDNVFTKITTSNNQDLRPLKTDDMYQTKRKYKKN